MFKLHNAAVLAAVASLWLAPASMAATAPISVAAAAPQAREAAAMQDWLSRAAVWSRGYSELTTRRVNTVIWLAEGPAVLVTKLQGPNKAGAREWVTTWAAEARTRLAGEMETYRGLPTSAPSLPSGLSLSPQDRARLHAMAQVSDRTGTLIITTGQAAEAYIQLMEAAATGNNDDLVRLDAGFYTLTIAHLQAEIVMAESFVDAAEGPAREFTLAQIEGNRALIVWSQYLHDAYFETQDGPATAASLREHAVALRQIVANLRSHLHRLSSDFRRETALQATPSGQTLNRTFSSMLESAAIEERLSVAIDELATVAASNNPAAGDPVADRIADLIAERVRLDAARREMLAGGQG